MPSIRIADFQQWGLEIGMLRQAGYERCKSRMKAKD
jgi:hypothetical protein